ncbi:MAG TPA: phosphate ABC transporter permease subunit PstC [Actinomycetota bacterium]|jgi:phosphate transport system permease protein|nr:phosphate ABC transporter permease subunit PstC [Actinomycetota bacterium]
MRGVFFAAALLAIVISVAIVLSLVGGAVDFLRKADLGTLWSRGWFPRRNLFDVKTIFVGTLMVSAIAMLVAAPLGLGAALYLSEYASRRSRRFLKPILETLASVPSVVMAFFALQFISPEVVQRFFGSDVPVFNITAAGIAVGLLVTPLVASVAEDAMYAVPNSLREASVGLGARRRTTSLRVVMPAAVSGITAALILGVSRAIGETMIVAIVAGGTGGSLFSIDPLHGGQTMTAAITSLATGSDQVRGSGPAYPSLFFVGLLLFLLTLALNTGAERFVRRVRRQY